MSLIDAWIMAGVAFIAGGFFGAALQLQMVMRDLDRLLHLIGRDSDGR